MGRGVCASAEGDVTVPVLTYMKYNKILLMSILVLAGLAGSFDDSALAAPARASVHENHLSAHQFADSSRASRHQHRGLHTPSGTFDVRGVGGTRVGGTIHVVKQGSTALLSLNAHGLFARSEHSIHLHAGSCNNPYGGVHLYVLGTLFVNGSGSGTLRASEPFPYVGGRRYVIVYEGLVPSTIVGCANLGSIR